MLKLLRKIPFFNRLRDRDLQEVYKISRIREYGPGEPIFRKSSEADRMFVVLSGRVKIFTVSGGRKRKTFAYVQQGDFFGEMALLEGKPRSASAEAVDYSKLLVIVGPDFNRLLTRQPELTLYLLRAVSQRLRRANEEIESLLFQNVLGRVARKLCDLARRGQRTREGLVLRESYTQQELADLVGTTREPLTRAVSALRRAELIAFRDDRYVIPHPEKLQALCLLQ